MNHDKFTPPPPAEASTEVGQEEPDFYGSEYILEELGVIVIGVIAIASVIGIVAFAVGRFL